MIKATPHIEVTEEGKIAKTVLMPGDPLRAKFIADTYLTEVRMFNDVRNMFGFTGEYNGKEVSVMGSGMGMPSIGIYSYELYSEYGVENIIRIGSAGSYSKDLDLLDVALADFAYSDSSYAKVMSGIEDHVIYPSKALNDKILDVAKQIGTECKLCHVYSSDVFYSPESFENISKRTDCQCVEMESFALFHNANVLGKNAACLLTISDSFVSKKELSSEDRQNGFKQMMEVALEAAIL